MIISIFIRDSLARVPEKGDVSLFTCWDHEKV